MAANKINSDKLSKLFTDVEVIKTKLEGFIQYVNEDLCKVNDDHEDRLREVELFKSKALGAILASGVLGSIIGILVQILFGK